jgi:hypothetical protein
MSRVSNLNKMFNEFNEDKKLQERIDTAQSGEMDAKGHTKDNTEVSGSDAGSEDDEVIPAAAAKGDEKVPNQKDIAPEGLEIDLEKSVEDHLRKPMAESLLSKFKEEGSSASDNGEIPDGGKKKDDDDDDDYDDDDDMDDMDEKGKKKKKESSDKTTDVDTDDGKKDTEKTTGDPEDHGKDSNLPPEEELAVTPDKNSSEKTDGEDAIKKPATAGAVGDEKVPSQKDVAPE